MDLRHQEESVGRDYVISVANDSVCKTLFCGSNPIAILGFYGMWNGVINVFVIPSRHVQRYAKTFLRVVRSELEALWDDPFLKLHRMETKSLANDETDRWMAWLGFQCEGTMVAYSADRKPYRIWARVRGDNGTAEGLDFKPECHSGV